MDSLGEIFVEVLADASRLAPSLSQGIAEAARAAGAELSNELAAAANAAADQMQLDLAGLGEDAGAALGEALSDSAAASVDTRDVQNAVRDGLSGLSSQVADAVDMSGPLAGVTSTVGDIGRELASIPTSIGATVVGALDTVASSVGRVTGYVGQVADDAASTLSGWGDRIETSRVYGAVDSMVAGVGDILSSGMATVGVAAGGVLVSSLVGGFSRLTGIETAEKQLEAMGLTADETAGLMDRLLDSLLGTPYALDEGARAMTGFVSAGVGLEDTSRYVDMLIDAAAFGQAPLGEVAGIFQQIALSNRAMTNELRQLEYRGIPAFALLSDALDMTGEEFQKFVSAGELTADVFFTAWEQGAKGFGENAIRIEGAAQGLGDTTVGALMNLRAALSRFGARLMDPFFDAVRDAAAGLNEVFTIIGDAIEPSLQRIADGPAFQGLLDFFGNLPDHAQAAVDALADLGPLLGPIIGAFTAFATQGMRMLPLIGQFVPAVSPLVGVVAGLVLGNEDLRDAVMDAVGALLPLAEAIAGTVLVVMRELAEVVVPLVVGALETVTPLFEWLGEQADWVAPLIVGVVGGIKLLPGVLSAAAGGFKILSAVMAANPFVLLAGAVAGAVAAIWYFRDEIVAGLTAAWEWVTDTTERVWSWFTDRLGAAWDWVGGAVGGVVGWFRALYDGVTGWVSDTVSAVGGWFQDLGGAIAGPFAEGWDQIVRGMQSAWEGIRGAWDSFWNTEIGQELRLTLETWKTFVTETWDTIGDWLSTKWDEISGWASETWGGIREWWSSLWGDVSTATREAWDETSGWLSETWTTISDTAVELWTPVQEFFVGVAGTVRDAVVSGWETVQTRTSEIWAALSEAAAVVWEPLREFFVTWAATVWATLTETWATITATLSEVWATISGTASELWNGMRDVVSTVTEEIKSIVGAAWEFLTGLFATAWEAMQGIVVGALRLMRGDIAGAMARIREAVSEAWETAKRLTREAWDTIYESVRTATLSLLDWVRGIPAKIVGALGNLGSLLWDAGRDLVGGLVGGIRNMGSAAADAVRDVASGAANRFRSFFGIDSPSRLMMEFGRDIGDGLAIGIAQSTSGVVREVERFARQVTDGMQFGPQWGATVLEADLQPADRRPTAVSPQSVTTAGVPAGGVTVHQTIVSPAPRQAGAAAARRLKDALYLSGGTVGADLMEDRLL